MGVVAAHSVGKVDKLSTRRIDETLYTGNVSGLARNQIINIHPVTRLEKNPAQIMSMTMADPTGQMVGKWVEKEPGISGVQTWAKLDGITSSVSSRDIMLLESSKDFRKVRDVGVFKTPGEIMNEDTKIATTGLGIQSITVATNVEYDGTYGGYSLYPPVGKHIYISPEGRIGLFVSMRYGGTLVPVEVYIYSDDGGKTWTWYRIDLSTSNPQTQGSFCADAYGNLHFVWREELSAADKRIRYRKYNATTKTFGSIQTVSAATGVATICPVIQPTPMGDSVEIMWGSNGYASDVNYPQLLLREVNADETLGTLYQLTTDGAITHRYIYYSFDYDSQGYRHIMAIAKCDTVNPDLGNVWYIRQTSGGWQPKVALNTDAGDVNALHYMSNILINKYDEVYCAYDIGPFDYVSKLPLYIKQIKNGVIGSRVTVEAGNPSPGGTVPSIQADSDGRICVVYASNTAPDTYSIRSLNRALTEIGTRIIIYTIPTGYEMSYFHIPWSIPPNVQGVNPNVPLQGMTIVMAQYASATPEKVDIQIHHTGNSVFGAPATPSKILTKSYNIRGIASRTKFNAGFNPVI
jgi:hypothetical protein